MTCEQWFYFDEEELNHFDHLRNAVLGNEECDNYCNFEE